MNFNKKKTLVILVFQNTISESLNFLKLSSFLIYHPLQEQSVANRNIFA